MGIGGERATHEIFSKTGQEDLNAGDGRRTLVCAICPLLYVTHASRLALLSIGMADLYPRVIATIRSVNDPWLGGGISRTWKLRTTLGGRNWNLCVVPPESRAPAESSCIFFSKIRIRAITFPTCLIGSRAPRGGNRQAERRAVRRASGRGAPLELRERIFFRRNPLKVLYLGPEIEAIGNLDFVASGFDLVAFGFDFVAPGLGFVAAGLVFVIGA